MSFDGPLLAGRWRVGPRLGEGAQGQTFLARDDREPSKAVVVKRLRLGGGSWKSFDLFEREARVLAGLRHPGIPRLEASFEEPPGTFNLVMQRMPGEDLRTLAARRRFSEAELRELLVQALELLDHLHTRAPPVVHRDLKPSNLVRAPTGALALVDFGGVLEAARDHGGSTIVGTFGYMAPEQLHGQATPATDLYALGATLVALAGGVEPEDVPRRGLQMDLERHLPAMDPALRGVLAAMTAPDPERRPQRARDVAALLARPPARPPTPVAGRAAPRPPRRRRHRMFRGAPEPVGTLLRLAVLAFAVGGWVGMEVARRLAGLVVRLAGGGPRLDGAREVVAMLQEGRDGFGDLARRCTGAGPPPALPPGDDAR